VFYSDGELLSLGDAGLRHHTILRSSAAIHADRTDCRRRELKGIEMTAGHIQVTGSTRSKAKSDLS